MLLATLNTFSGLLSIPQFTAQAWSSNLIEINWTLKMWPHIYVTNYFFSLIIGVVDLKWHCADRSVYVQSRLLSNRSHGALMSYNRSVQRCFKSNTPYFLSWLVSQDCYWCHKIGTWFLWQRERNIHENNNFPIVCVFPFHHFCFYQTTTNYAKLHTVNHSA